MAGNTGRPWTVTAVAVLAAGGAAWLAPAGAGEHLENQMPWTIATRITTASASPDASFRAFDGQNLQWLDLDGDGAPEILARNANGRVYVFSPEGDLLEENRAPSGSGHQADNVLPGIPVADMDGDGNMDLVYASNNGRLARWEVDPTNPSFDLDSRWTKCLSCGPEMDATPWYAEGRVFTQGDDVEKQWGLRASSGSVAWTRSGHGGNAGAVADLDGDGSLEVVFATDQGRVLARSRDGSTQWSVNLRDRLDASPGAVPYQPTVEDLDGDGDREIAVSVKVSGGRGWYVLLSHTGSVLWQVRVPDGHPMGQMHPAAVDVNGDGRRDIVWEDWNTDGNPDYDYLGRAHLFALDGRDGDLLWIRDVDTTWSNKDVAVADVDGDGRQEILVPERRNGDDGIAVFTLGGARDGWWAVPDGWKVTRGVVAVPWEGRLHLLVAISQPARSEGIQSLDATSPTGQLLLVDTGVAFTEPAWSGRYDFAS